MERLTRDEVISQLRNQTIRINDLESCFAGWPFATNPAVERIRKDVDAWLSSRFPDHPKLEKLRAGDYGLFGATWWPCASEERLRVATYFSIWLFIWDDEIDSATGRLAAEFDMAQNYRSETLEFVQNRLGLGDSKANMTSTNPIIASFDTIGEALRESYTIEQREQLLAEVKLFMEMSETEQRLKLLPHLPTVEDSWKYRLGASAVGSVLCLNEYCYNINLPRYVFLDKDMTRLWDMTNINICSINDLLSVKKELAADTTESLVPILYAKLHCAQSAADEIVASVRDTVNEFDLTAQRLLQRFAKDPDIDNIALQNFIDGLLLKKIINPEAMIGSPGRYQAQYSTRIKNLTLPKFETSWLNWKETQIE